MGEGISAKSVKHTTGFLKHSLHRNSVLFKVKWNLYELHEYIQFNIILQEDTEDKAFISIVLIYNRKMFSQNSISYYPVLGALLLPTCGLDNAIDV